MIPVLAVGAVIGGAFLVAVRRVVGAVEIEQDAAGWATLSPLPQVELAECLEHAGAGTAGHGVLQAGEGWLGGQVRRGLRQAATYQLEEGVGPQGGGVVLVLVAAGDLVDPLAHQRQQRVRHRPAPPFWHTGGQRLAYP